MEEERKERNPNRGGIYTTKNDIQRRMENTTARDKIAKAKLKRAYEKIQNLAKKINKEKLDILSEVSLHASNTK